MVRALAVLLAVGIPILWGVGTYHLFEHLRRRRDAGKADDA